MPKLKTHKGTAKRVKITSSGKVLRGNSASHHFMTQRTKRTNRTKRINPKVVGKDVKNIKRSLGE